MPRTTAVYATAGLNITSFTEGEYEKIENDLQTYTSTYRSGKIYANGWTTSVSYSDTWKESTGLTESEYNTQKKKMLKSVYKNGGFYIGRYEMGCETERESQESIAEEPVIKKNVYAYITNDVKLQELAQRFATDGYSTSLMFGVQWDLVMKYLEEKGTSQNDLRTDSKSWGNYYDSTFTTNADSKYSIDRGNTYVTGSYTKTENGYTTLTTGASETFAKQNIYDLAGNRWELTLETSTDDVYSCMIRSGNYENYGSFVTAAGRRAMKSSIDAARVALYKDEWEEMENYTRYYDASNLDGNGATGTTTTTIKDLSGEYDGQIEGSPTFGNEYISLNEGSTTDFIDIGPMLDKSTMTIDVKFSTSNSCNEDNKKYHIIGNWDYGGIGFYIWNKKIMFCMFRENGTGYEEVFSTTSVQANTIYDITTVYDGKNMYLYVNGVLEASKETEGGNIKNPTTNVNMIIGGNPTMTNGELAVDSSFPMADMKLYSASITSTTNHPNILTSSMCSRLQGYETWNGTTLKIDSSSVNTNLPSQHLRVQRCLDWKDASDIVNGMKGTGSYNCTFIKDSSFNQLILKLNGNVRDDGLSIDISSLTNGKTYKLSFDVTEYGEWTATITNIKLQLQS